MNEKKRISLPKTEGQSWGDLNEVRPGQGYFRPLEKEKISLDQILFDLNKNNTKIDQFYPEPSKELKGSNKKHQPKQNNKKWSSKNLDPSSKKQKNEEKKVENQPQCLICSQLFPKASMVYFSFNCLHQLCQDCFFEYMLTQISSFKKITCPFEGCPQFLGENSLYLQQLPLVMQQQYYSIMVQQYVTQSSQIKSKCPDEKCKGYVMIGPKPFCIVCNTEYCPKCMLKNHKGSCEENGAIYLENKYNYTKCQKCRWMVEKTQGCDHMTCKCGYQFCYKCGNKWSTKHKCIKLTKANAEAPRYNPAPNASNIPRINIQNPAPAQPQRPIIPPPVIRRIPTPSAPIPIRQSQQQSSRRNQTHNILFYFLFGIAFVDFLLTVLVIGYLILSFLAVLLVGMTIMVVYEMKNSLCQQLCEPKSNISYVCLVICIVLIVPIMISSAFDSIKEYWVPHVTSLIEKEVLFPLYNKCGW